MENEYKTAAAAKPVRAPRALRDALVMKIDPGTEHPVTNIPFSAIIDGRQFTGSSVSLVSATISGLASSELEGVQRIVTLRFGFGTYAISVPVLAHINRTDPATGTLRLDFVEPAGDHLPVLRYMINSYVAGEIVSVGGLISAREKNTNGAQAKQLRQMTAMQRAKVLAKGLATGMATLALLAIAGNLVMNRLFASEVSQLAVATQGGEAMRAIASGQVALLNLTAAKGEVVYAIRSASGDTLNVVMPCDCKVAPSQYAEGSTVLAGETIVRLLRAGAVPSVEAVVTPAQAKSLMTGDVAELAFADGSKKTIVLDQSRSSIIAIPGSDNLRVAFQLEAALPEGAINTPVAVRILDGRVQRLVSNVFGSNVF